MGRRIITAAVFLMVITAGGAMAQIQRGGQFNGCVSARYGGQYNWLQFVNNCNQAVHIAFYWRDRDYSGSGSDNVGPGSVMDTGWSNSEVQSHGAYELYICPAGYLPVDASGAMIVNGGSNPQRYECKHQ